MSETVEITDARRVGAPSTYSHALAAEICTRLAAGESLRRVCRRPGMPDPSTVYDWLNDPRKAEFTEQYSRARAAQADTYADEIVDIADDSKNDYIEGENGPELNPEAVQRARLRVDARKWFASKLAPKKYGEKIEHTGEVTHRHLTLAELDERLKLARARPGQVVDGELAEGEK